MISFHKIEHKIDKKILKGSSLAVFKKMNELLHNFIIKARPPDTVEMVNVFLTGFAQGAIELILRA